MPSMVVSTDADVKAAFGHVSRSYRAVRDAAGRSDSRVAREDLRPVTQAFLDLERAMGSYPADAGRYRLSEH